MMTIHRLKYDVMGLIKKYNPYHDEQGKFSEAPGGALSNIVGNKSAYKRFIKILNTEGLSSDQMLKKLSKGKIYDRDGNPITAETLSSYIKQNQDMAVLDNAAKALGLKTQEAPKEEAPKAPTLEGSQEQMPKGYQMTGNVVEFAPYEGFKTVKEAIDHVKEKCGAQLYVSSKFGPEEALSWANNIARTVDMISEHVDLQEIGVKRIRSVQTLANGILGDIQEIDGDIRLNAHLLNPNDKEPWGIHKKNKIDELKSKVEKAKQTSALSESSIKAAEEDIEARAKALAFGARYNPNSGLIHGIGEVSDNRMMATLFHEIGHQFHYYHRDEIEKELGLSGSFGNPIIKKLSEGKYTITKYGKTNAFECFAENFCAYMIGEVRYMDPKMRDYLDKKFPKLAFGKRLLKSDIQGVKNGIIEMIRRFSNA